MAKSILAISLMILLSACGSEYSADTRRDGTTIDTTTTVSINQTLTFSDVYTALKSKCLSCHGTSGGFTLGSSAVPLSEAEAYNNIMVFTSGTTIAGNTHLLQKAIGNLGHGGGSVLNTGAYEYLITSEWIEAGSSIDASFDVNTTGTTTTTIPISNPGYDVPTATASSFTRNHKDGFAPVQGKACIQCHDTERTDPIEWGGTLFSYIHTPNAKYYQDLSSYRVNIVGENGSNIRATTRSSGSEIGHNNFSSVSSIGSNIAFTAYVKDSNGDVVNQSGTNTHNSSTHLDCNKCHTETGANSAPGRVLVPLVN